jgi:hypothetical protein
MKRWKKSDIGKIIVYKKQMSLSSKLEDEKIIIYSVNKKIPNTVGFVEYPISLSSKIHTPYISSKIGLVGIVKSQRKESPEYLEKAGDWCFIDKVSKDEMGELEKIAKAPKIPSYEDLSPEDIFKS